MPRRPRRATGGCLFHALNRGVRRNLIFETDGDYRDFESILITAKRNLDMRLLAYCLMPNHWHLVLWPTDTSHLSRFMHWLTVTHTQRWHAFHGTGGTGPLYQGRYKAFPVQSDSHFLTVCRYVERNPVRAQLVESAQDWPWSSAARHGKSRELDWLDTWPIPRPMDWSSVVNQTDSVTELRDVRMAVQRGAPFGEARWVHATTGKLDLQRTLRARGRPKKTPDPF